MKTIKQFDIKNWNFSSMEVSQLKQLNEWIRNKPTSEYLVPSSCIPTFEVYSDINTLELTKSIDAFFKVAGGFSNRLNTTGRMIKNKAGNWITVPGYSIKGTPDIIAGLNGITFHCEIKHSKDKMSDDQLEYRRMIEEFGDPYLICRNFDGFICTLHFLLKKRGWKM